MLSVSTTISLKSLRQYSSKFREISIPVPWGIIAGKWWGSTGIKPILCLHGYQDNCGSFDRLIPLILEGQTNMSFLALDFPGHGFSTRFPHGMIYDFFSFHHFIQRVKDYFKWETVSLMGHSLGSMTSLSYSMMYPDKIDSLISVDGLKMPSQSVSTDLLRTNLELYMKFDEHKCNGDEPKSYSIEELKKKITSAHRNSVKPEVAMCLMERNIASSKKYPGKYYFTRDPFLKLRLLFYRNHNQILEDMAHVTCPILIFKGTESTYFESKENYAEALEVLKKSSIDFNFHYIEGSHHFHLNDPEKISSIINSFLNKYNRYNKRRMGNCE